MTDTQKIFLLSKANGADNAQEMLPAYRWDFPRDTWLQRRLAERAQKEDQ